MEITWLWMGTAVVWTHMGWHPTVGASTCTANTAAKIFQTQSSQSWWEREGNDGKGQDRDDGDDKSNQTAEQQEQEFQPKAMPSGTRHGTCG